MTRKTDPTEHYSMPDRFGWIDGLRGIAALAVVVFHYHHFYLANAADRSLVPPSSSFPWSPAMGFLYEHGGSAVQLFWVISGFVFAHVYLTRMSSLRGFIVARVARLYPLHFVTLIFVAALQLASMSWVGHEQVYGNNDMRHFGLQLLMASNWTVFSRGLSFNGPIWSVSLEIVAYGMFFVALPAIRRFGLIAAVGLSGFMWWVGLNHSLDIPGISRGAFICAAYFFLGTGIYLILNRATPNVTLLGVLFLVGGGLCALGYWYDESHLLLASTSFLVVIAVALIDIRWPRSTLSPLKRLGDMSYSIYLVHVPLQILVLFVADSLFAGTRAFADSALTLPVFLLVTIAVSDLCYRRFEIPASKFLRRSLGR